MTYQFLNCNISTFFKINQNIHLPICRFSNIKYIFVPLVSHALFSFNEKVIIIY